MKSSCCLQFHFLVYFAMYMKTNYMSRDGELTFMTSILDQVSIAGMGVDDGKVREEGWHEQSQSWNTIVVYAFFFIILGRFTLRAICFYLFTLFRSRALCTVFGTYLCTYASIYFFFAE